MELSESLLWKSSYEMGGKIDICESKSLIRLIPKSLTSPKVWLTSLLGVSYYFFLPTMRDILGLLTVYSLGKI